MSACLFVGRRDKRIKFFIAGDYNPDKKLYLCIIQSLLFISSKL